MIGSHNTSCSHRHKSFSYHNHLWLQLDPCDEAGPKPFRTPDVWLNDPRFKPFVQQTWHSMGGLSLPAKLKALKEPIRAWNINHFGNIQIRISKLEKEIENIDSWGT